MSATLRQMGRLIPEPLVLVNVRAIPKLEALIDQGRRREWRMLSVDAFYGDYTQSIIPHGAIIEPNPELEGWLHSIGCPYVRLSSYIDPSWELNTPLFLPDLIASGRLAAHHLAERGFLQMGFVGYSPWGRFRGMYEAFKSEAECLGGECHLLQFTQSEKAGRYQERLGRFSEWIRQIPRPFGLFCYNDDQASRICLMCQQLGVSIPEEVALVSRGNERVYCEMSSVPISSIDTNLQDLIVEAVETLGMMMAGENVPGGISWIPPRGVMARRSTDILAVADPLVARALRYVWDHAHEPITVPDICQAVGVSRRKLERSFREHLGRSIHDELLARRFQDAKRLLRETALPMPAVARESGIGTVSSLNRLWQRKLGTTPLAYRKNQECS